MVRLEMNEVDDHDRRQGPTQASSDRSAEQVHPGPEIQDAGEILRG